MEKVLIGRYKFEDRKAIAELYVKEDGVERQVMPDSYEHDWNHNEKFEWGCYGSGATQLAIYMLAEMGLDKYDVYNFHASLAIDVVFAIDPLSSWTMTQQQFNEWLDFSKAGKTNVDDNRKFWDETSYLLQ